MYRSLMNWSNVVSPSELTVNLPKQKLSQTVLSCQPVSELVPLEERLLCVEVSEASVQLVTMVMTEVASVADFVNFLPLANRVSIISGDIHLILLFRPLMSNQENVALKFRFKLLLC